MTEHLSPLQIPGPLSPWKMVPISRVPHPGSVWRDVKIPDRMLTVSHIELDENTGKNYVVCTSFNPHRKKKQVYITKIRLDRMRLDRKVLPMKDYQYRVIFVGFYEVELKR